MEKMFSVEFQFSTGQCGEAIIDTAKIQANTAEEAREQFYVAYGDFYMTAITEDK